MARVESKLRRHPVSLLPPIQAPVPGNLPMLDTPLAVRSREVVEHAIVLKIVGYDWNVVEAVRLALAGVPFSKDNVDIKMFARPVCMSLGSCV
jgi:hypothetical protein